jgi:hypothetical protein
MLSNCFPQALKILNKTKLVRVRALPLAAGINVGGHYRVIFNDCKL